MPQGSRTQTWLVTSAAVPVATDYAASSINVAVTARWWIFLDDVAGDCSPLGHWICGWGGRICHFDCLAICIQTELIGTDHPATVRRDELIQCIPQPHALFGNFLRCFHLVRILISHGSVNHVCRGELHHAIPRSIRKRPTANDWRVKP
jgi:hypothetical protein